MTADDSLEPYRVMEQWHSAPGELRVIHVGAGAAGLLLAYKMKKLFKEYELVCYEKNPHIAGTWYENRYPGCACDIPAHSYTYSFEPNPNWSTFYAYAPEIRQYFEEFARKHELHQFIKVNSRVLSATWIEEKGIYDVLVESDGVILRDWCTVLVNGTGFLNNWKWPNIPGLHDFRGTLTHSAAWDPSIDCTDKTVAIMGTGSSAIQIVPQVQKVAKTLISFMRSVTWISPPVGVRSLQSLKENDSRNGGSIFPGSENLSEAQYYYTEDEKRKFRENPEHHLLYRRSLEKEINARFRMFLKDSEQSKAAEEYMRKEMLRRIGPGHDELKQKLIPSWPPGCRRLTPGDGYLEALVKPNVKTVHKEITKIVEDGVIDEDGVLHKVDILICATGFNLAFAPPLQVAFELRDVRGVNGVSMADEFNPVPHVYLAVTVPKFPNYFVINGVRGNWSSGCALPSHEVQVEYILKCVKRIQNEGIRAFEVKREPVDELYEHIDEWHKRSVWNAPCKSWYKNNIVGGKLWVWAGSALHYMKTLENVKYEDYELRYHRKNKWAYLGNGQVEAEISGPLENLAPYVRNEDIAWSI